MQGLSTSPEGRGQDAQQLDAQPGLRVPYFAESLQDAVLTDFNRESTAGCTTA